MTNVTHKFISMYLFYLQLSTGFEHIVLIIRRDKLYQYNLW
jgi:hypothetical protein